MRVCPTTMTSPLLREVEAATGGGGSAPDRPPCQRSLPRRGRRRSPPPAVAGGWGTNLLISGAAGAIVTAVLLGIIPFSRSFGLISFALAGFLGGVVGCGATRLLHRKD